MSVFRMTPGAAVLMNAAMLPPGAVRPFSGWEARAHTPRCRSWGPEA